ncbi:sulfotransferase family 2 domain-containing protein [Photobacterium satsumensis]|uniref:sulfotransferase family 2 domain-containing protein n=1 Tax=Photobacterium satsumensis TaxID=2910239 RepID=UPI003D0AA3C9
MVKKYLRLFFTPEQRLYLAKKIGLVESYRSHFDETETIFIHIPKAAGMSIVNALYSVDNSSHLCFRSFLKKDPDKFKKYFKFTIVRNPYERVISAYSYLKKGGMHDIDKFWHDKYLKDYSNISEFIEFGLEKAVKSNAEHFIPQYKYIYDDNEQLMVDFVGKIEHIANDFEFISSHFMGNKKLEKINTSKHDKITLSEKDKDYIFRVYKEDFRLLGYEK